MIRLILTYILACCSILSSISAFCQSYRVCDVSCSPAEVTVNGGKRVLRNNILAGEEILKFQKFSKISLMDIKSKEIFFFSGEGELSVSEVVGRNKTKLKNNLKSHLRDLINGKSHSKVAGVVYKDNTAPITHLDDEYLQIADSSGNIVDKNSIEPEQIYYFVVSNSTDNYFFTNVIRKDIKSTVMACCATNDAISQLDLIIPPHSKTLLSSFPQIGKVLKSGDITALISESPFDVNYYIEQNSLVQILSPNNNSIVSYPNITLRTLIKDCDKIASIRVSINNKDIKSDTPQHDGINEIEIKLPQYGVNLVEITSTDTSGSVHTKQLSLNYEKLNKPKLHIMSVGIGNYKDEAIEKLHFAASDANMVSQVLDTLRIINNQLYEVGGYNVLLTDADATRINILKCLDDMTYQSDSEDIVMVYISGHGKYVEFTSQRYFLPYDTDNDYIESTAINYAELKGKLKQLEDKECKVIVYMDACYAGEMYFTKGAEDFIGDSEPALIGFYSSTRNQLSLEKIDLNHGVFTYALLNGIKGGAKDSNGNVTITSLGDYITEQVRIESKGKQTPKVDNGGEDFIIFKASDLPINVSTNKVDAINRNSIVATDEKKNPVIELAENYYNGVVKPATMEDEFNAYMSASNLGDANSTYMVGVCYELGKGCTQNFTLAQQWYEKAAVKGVAAAQYNLGAMYYNGTGITKSVELAEKWFKEAAYKDYVKGYSALGHLYYYKEVPDYKKAFDNFEKAAHKGDEMALFYLGECYLYGYGTHEDISAAIEAYKKSAEKGYEAAKEKLLEIDY